MASEQKINTHLPEDEINTAAVNQVSRYYSRWDFAKQEGRISLYDPLDRNVGFRTFSDPTEFRLAMDFLRNETPLYYDSSRSRLYTGAGAQGEPVGEEES